MRVWIGHEQCFGELRYEQVCWVLRYLGQVDPLGTVSVVDEWRALPGDGLGGSAGRAL